MVTGGVQGQTRRALYHNAPGKARQVRSARIRAYHGPMSLTDTELEQLRAALLAQRAALDETRAANAEASATVELDQTRVGRLSRMDALQGQAMSQAAGQRREQMRVRIESALRRMDAGEYGDCLCCEEPIAAARLFADPATTLCIRCASASEH